MALRKLAATAVILGGAMAFVPLPPLSKVADCDLVVELASKDSAFFNPIYLCESGDSLYYTGVIRTPVCNDGNCRIAQLRMYWDLAGYYLRFDTVPGNPLTKWDHLPFTSEDYAKLQRTLAKPTSVLGEKAYDELIDHSAVRESNKIDGVTGATSRKVKHAVVDGALYSTYTLWQMANGDVTNHLRSHTVADFSQARKRQLLRSQRPKSVLFALKQFEEEDFHSQFDEVFKLLTADSPLVSFYLSKAMPASVLEKPEYRNQLIGHLDSLDPNSRAYLKQRLAIAD